jgi:hypothetical protein
MKPKIAKIDVQCQSPSKGPLFQGCIFFYNSPPGVGEKNQRVLGLGKKIKEE